MTPSRAAIEERIAKALLAIKRVRGEVPNNGLSYPAAIEKASDALVAMRDDLPFLLSEIDRLGKELENKNARIVDAEVALGTWDASRSSEYWLRHESAQLSATDDGEGK